MRWRRTRQIIAIFIGDYMTESGQHFWHSILQNYRHSITYSDFWKAYDQVIQKSKHYRVGKDTAQTNHM